MTAEQVRPWLSRYPDGVEAELHVQDFGLYDMLVQTVSRYPGQHAIIYGGQKITYRQFKDRVDRLAAAWDSLELKKGDRLGLMVSNQPAYFIAYYAAQKLGLIIVQVNPFYTVRELDEIFADSCLSYLVIEEAGIPKIKETVHRCKYVFAVSLSGSSLSNDSYYDLGDLIDRFEPQSRQASISPKDDIAVIQYTGGTTGRKKGAMLTHHNLIANVIQSKVLYGDILEFGAETILAVTPLYHVYGMTVAMNLGIYMGAANLLIEKFEVNEVLQSIQKHRPTFFPGVPKMYSAFVNHPDIGRFGLDCLKICSCGSAPLPLEVIRQFEELTGAAITEGYGLSETSPSTHRNPVKGMRKVGSIGIPLPGTDCKIISEQGKVIPAGSVGELLVKGPQVMTGYWNKDSETAEAIRDGWFYTGDLAAMDEDGYFYITGRKKEMIIVGGFNVYPQEIEHVLYEHSDIQEAAVLGVPDGALGEKVKAFITAKPGRKIDLESVTAHCRRQLTPYKVPKVFEIRETLPRNSVGKLLKRKLAENERKSEV